MYEAWMLTLAFALPFLCLGLLLWLARLEDTLGEGLAAEPVVEPAVAEPAPALVVVTPDRARDAAA